MAKFEAEIPNDVLKQFEALSDGKMTEEMVKEGGKVVYNLVLNNMRRSFKTTKALEKGLKLTKVYKTPSDDGINVYVGFYGYADSEHEVTVITHSRGHTYRYMRDGVPIPLIAMAREYGTSNGEKKKPFLRKSFKKAEIEQAMQKVEDKYIKGD